MRGDAVAGILILLINIIGGLAIGMGSARSRPEHGDALRPADDR